MVRNSRDYVKELPKRRVLVLPSLQFEDSRRPTGIYELGLNYAPLFPVLVAYYAFDDRVSDRLSHLHVFDV